MTIHWSCHEVELKKMQLESFMKAQNTIKGSVGTTFLSLTVDNNNTNNGPSE